MLIAEHTQVCAAYPDVPAKAVEHMLWALHRARPAIEAGHVDSAMAGLHTDLAGYDGPLTDLDAFAPSQLLRALAAGRIAFADALTRARLTRAEAPTARYVVVGPLLDVRMWARERGIGQGTVIPVLRATDTFRLRGLTGRGLAVVRIGRGRPDPVVENALDALIAGGAITLSASWRPGEHPDPAEPQLDLQVDPRAVRPQTA